MLHGAPGPCGGNVPGIGRLAIPPLCLNDGPQVWGSGGSKRNSFNQLSIFCFC